MKKIASANLTAVLATAMGTAMAGDAAHGAKLAKKCAGCHGKKGEGRGKNPKIAGLSVDDIVTDLQAYKDGTKKNSMMRGVSKKLSEGDMADRDAYYNGLK